MATGSPVAPMTIGIFVVACLAARVDGDPAVRPLLEHILLDNGYQVVTAESVATATRLSGSQPFDLVLCDVNLPDGSGLTVADRAIAAGVKAHIVRIAGQLRGLQQLKCAAVKDLHRAVTPGGDEQVIGGRIEEC